MLAAAIIMAMTTVVMATAFGGVHMSIVTPVKRAFAEIALSTDGKFRDEFLITFDTAFWAFAIFGTAGE